MARRQATRTRAARASALALTIAAFAGFAAPAAQAGWSKPFEFVKPVSLDLIPSQLAFSDRGVAAAAFGVEDVDTPGVSQGYVTIRSASDAIGAARPIGNARRVVALTYDGPALELLTATSPAAMTCCSAVQAVRLTAGGSLQPPRTLLSGLTGVTEGRLLTLGDGAMLAALGTERGVWVVQSAESNRFGSPHRLTRAGEMPETLAAAGLGGQSTVVAWTAGTGSAGSADPRSIYYSTGSRSGPPRRARTLLTVPVGHRIDELGVARRGSGTTAAWVQSWFDRRGSFHSEVDAAEFTGHPAIRRLSALDQPASGLTIAGDASGDQAVAWKSCRGNGSCTAQATVRSPGADFGRAHELGRLDAPQTPAPAVGPRGQVVVGWIRGGHPVASAGSARTGLLGAAQVLSSTVYAHDLTVGFGPSHGALAAWSQGTLNPSVVGAAYTG